MILIKKYFFSGVSRTKQLAKRQAARLMYDKIIQLSRDEIVNLSLNPTPSKVMWHQITSEKKKDIEKSKSVNTLKTIEGFYTKLKMSNNPSVNKLKVIYYTLDLISNQNLNILKYIKAITSNF